MTLTRKQIADYVSSRTVHMWAVPDMLRAQNGRMEATLWWIQWNKDGRIEAPSLEELVAKVSATLQGNYENVTYRPAGR